MKRILTLAAVFAATVSPAFAHIGLGSTASFAAGIAHPISGLDHVTAMIAVGLWAALKGGRALWIWPATFVGVMLVGGALGMAHVPVPFVEPGILASVVALGLLVALAIDLPIAIGAAIIGAFALLHGHAHGAEVARDIGGVRIYGGICGCHGVAARAWHSVRAADAARGSASGHPRRWPCLRASGRWNDCRSSVMAGHVHRPLGAVVNCVQGPTTRPIRRSTAIAVICGARGVASHRFGVLCQF